MCLLVGMWDDYLIYVLPILGTSTVNYLLTQKVLVYIAGLLIAACLAVCGYAIAQLLAETSALFKTAGYRIPPVCWPRVTCSLLTEMWR